MYLDNCIMSNKMTSIEKDYSYIEIIVPTAFRSLQPYNINGSI